MSTSDAPVAARVGVLLARWYNAGLHDRWSTTAAVPGNDSAYKLEARSGFLLTAAPAGKPSTEVEDCVSERPGHPDHLLAQKGFCEAHAYQRLRTAAGSIPSSKRIRSRSTNATLIAKRPTSPPIGRIARAKGGWKYCSATISFNSREAPRR